MAFETIGFHANLILNRLRNERDKRAIADEQEGADRAQERTEEQARADLAFVKQRLRDIAKFERRARGEDRPRRKP